MRVCQKKSESRLIGFGRIGRLTYRASLQHPEIEVVAINNRSTAEQTARMFKYDSVHGTFDGEVSFDEEHIIVDGHKIRKLQVNDPKELPWKDFDVDVVVECTGVFRTKEQASWHLEAGAKKVLLSAPAKGEEPVKTIVLGVNDEELKAEDVLLSNASCTTNCFAPIAKVLNDNFGIELGYMATVHAYTADQQLVDGKHKDPRRARAAALNVCPTTSGAAKAVCEVIPELQGKLNAEAVRVPVPDGSLVYFVATLNKETSAEEINNLFREVSEHHMKGILRFCEDPVVSSDIVGDSHSCVFDSLLTSANGKMVKIVAWYDNEYGYSCRMADMLVKMG